MTFPVPLKINGKDPNAVQLKALRTGLLANIFRRENATQDVPGQLAQIAQVLGRQATNDATTYENGGVSTSATGNAGVLTRQVERAISQVLGRAPGRGAEGFMQALYGTFPTKANGQVMTTPARSVVSLYSSYGNGNQVLPGNNGQGLTGQIPVEQANLYRQTSILATDALRVLEGLKPFDPTADIDAVEALRALIRSQINTIVEEFGRLDEPRPDRVNVYLSTLRNNLDQLGIRARLSGISDAGEPDEAGFPVTADDEAQVAALELLKNYIQTLDDIWRRFLQNNSLAEQISGNYSERLARVSILLPVIASSNQSFMAAMDSVGFTESERRADAALFTGLGPPFEFSLSIDDPDGRVPDPLGSGGIDLPPATLAGITVNDYNEWLDRFATLEAPTILADSGRFGLDFVTDQADTLFWVIAFVLDYIETRRNGGRESLLENIFTFERVRQTLGELVFQLDTLANFSVTDTRIRVDGSIIRSGLIRS